jgi:hypothetical protein
MTVVAFDTLKFAQTLRDKAHFSQADTEGVAEAFADATGDQLATKADLREQTADLRAEIAGLGAALRAESAGLGTALRAESAGLGAALRAEVAPLKADLLLLKWMTGFVLALLAAILGHMLLR